VNRVGTRANPRAQSSFELLHLLRYGDWDVMGNIARSRTEYYFRCSSPKSFGCSLSQCCVLYLKARRQLRANSVIFPCLFPSTSIYVGTAPQIEPPSRRPVVEGSNKLRVLGTLRIFFAVSVETLRQVSEKALRLPCSLERNHNLKDY
jgi:hypothetical protein